MNNEVFISFNGPFDIVETGNNGNVNYQVDNVIIPNKIIEQLIRNNNESNKEDDKLEKVHGK